KQFPVVEVQQTFYDPPPIGTLEKWRRQAPAGFEFTMKAWQVITHLGESPASFRPTADNVAAMRRFLTAIDRPASVRLLWEPRGAWPNETVAGLCRELDLVHAVDPFVRPSVTPQLLYWRLHGNKSHYARYTDDELRQIIDWLAADPAID